MSDNAGFELIEVSDWPDELHMHIRGLRELDSVYALLQLDPPDDQLYHRGMDFMRSARRERRVEIAAAILGAHGIILEDDPEPPVPA